MNILQQLYINYYQKPPHKHRKTNRNDTTSDIHWIEKLIKILKHNPYSAYLRKKVYSFTLSEYISGLPGLYKYHNNIRPFEKFSEFALAVRELFYVYLSADVLVDTLDSSRRCKAIQIMAEILSNEVNLYLDTHKDADINSFLFHDEPDKENPEVTDNSILNDSNTNDNLTVNKSIINNTIVNNNSTINQNTEIIEEDENEIYCICRQKNDGSNYFQCTKCLKWFHPGCLGLYPCLDKTHSDPCYCNAVGKHIDASGDMYCHMYILLIYFIDVVLI